MSTDARAPGWRWQRLAMVTATLVVIAAACADDDGGAGATTAPATTAPPTTAPATTAPATTAPATTATTTTAPATTTTTAAPMATDVPVSLVSALLGAYNPEGLELFADGTVEAVWYQRDGFYVVLYRGLDADAVGPLCPGNSILTSLGFAHVTNSPLGADAADVCVDSAKIAAVPAGVQRCGTLVYYVTEIPVDATGTLYGTVEINDGSGFAGHTSTVAADISATPEFVPGMSAYSLPDSAVDAAFVASC